MTDIAVAIAPFRAQLPVVTQEIGDTWIHGVPSDPMKLARYREVARFRRELVAVRRAQQEFSAVQQVRESVHTRIGRGPRLSMRPVPAENVLCLGLSEWPPSVLFRTRGSHWKFGN